jgi:homoserine kinase
MKRSRQGKARQGTEIGLAFMPCLKRSTRKAEKVVPHTASPLGAARELSSAGSLTLKLTSNESVSHSITAEGAERE